MATVGRPPVIADAERVNSLISSLRAGATIDNSCRYARIAPSSYYRALELAKAEDEAGTPGQYTEFRETVENARAEAEIAAVVIIRRAMRDDWRAAAWFLEKSMPDLYGKAAEASKLEMLKVTLTERMRRTDVDVPAELESYKEAILEYASFEPIPETEVDGGYLEPNDNAAGGCGPGRGLLSADTEQSIHPTQADDSTGSIFTT